MSGADSRGIPSEPEYLSAVESRLSELAGTPLILSTREWERVRRWRERAIPLDVVLRALDDVLGRGRATGEGEEKATDHEEADERGARRARSLAYCERAVEQRFRSRRDSAIGRRGTPPPPLPRVRAALRDLARSALAAARAASRSAGPGPALATPLHELAARLRSAATAAGGEDPLHSVTPILIEAEAFLRRGIRSAVGEGWEDICSAERCRLGLGLERMSAEGARQTIEASVLRQLRERFDIPSFDPGALHARLQQRSYRSPRSAKP